MPRAGDREGDLRGREISGAELRPRLARRLGGQDPPRGGGGRFGRHPGGADPQST